MVLGFIAGTLWSNYQKDNRYIILDDQKKCEKLGGELVINTRYYNPEGSDIHRFEGLFVACYNFKTPRQEFYSHKVI